LGSVNVISDYQGREFEYREYTPYGESWLSEAMDSALASSIGLELGFTGHIEDKETGLIYANARYLDPKTSRGSPLTLRLQSTALHSSYD
jgi:hypothetical protein